MDIVMPQLGETVTEGKIISWFKALGDTVAAGDALFEIETDKATMEVEATAPGVLSEIRVPAGEVAPVNVVVAVVSAAGVSAVPALTRAASPAAAAPTPPPTPPRHSALEPFNDVRSPERNFGPATLTNGAKITPLARRLAAEAGLEVSRLTGSGPHGRIVAADVHRARTNTAAPTAGPEDIRAQYAGVAYEEVALDGMRRTIARRLVESKQAVPHFYLTTDVEMEKLLAVRREINASDGRKLSVNDFVVKAFAMALQRAPAANAVWAHDRILMFERSDIGVAIAVEGGLFTPVIRSADTMSLSQLSSEMVDLAGRARARKLKPSEYQGGSASVSNLGMHGVRQFQAIINPPQASILAVGAAERRPKESEDGTVRFVSQMTVTLSADHRVVDGALGAELLTAFKSIVENPLTMLV